MEILMFCGYFEEQYYSEVNAKTKTWVENAANTFQQRLIRGIQDIPAKLTVVSAPFIGAWPTVYSDVYFKGFHSCKKCKHEVEYVDFCNIWGYRNISRTKALKKVAYSFAKTNCNEEKAIIVYSPHTPFLEAAVYAKMLLPKIHVCMVVPDLPQYMNLSKDAHPFYDFFKRIDINNLMRLNQKVDSYMLLTEQMKKAMQVGQRPYIIVEGITDTVGSKLKGKSHQDTQIAYAGKLTEAFGVKALVDAFEMIAQSGASLEICGGGELSEYIVNASKMDARIHYHGVVSAKEAAQILQEADVLVNPRQNNDEYTKYSFPSKDIEYLMTGNAVVAYMLDGMPQAYKDFIIAPDENSIEALCEAMLKACNEDQNTCTQRAKKSQSYILEHCNSKSVAKRLLKMFQ